VRPKLSQPTTTSRRRVTGAVGAPARRSRWSRGPSTKKTSTSAATDDAGEPVPTRTVVVEEGDTLWGIAASVAEPGETRAMVHHLQRLNALPGAGVYVGQRIAVPTD